MPCGAQLTVLVPLGAALGTTDEVAELVGHGTLEPDLLHELLLAAPQLRAVGVDRAGVPVTNERGVRTPRRGDAREVRAALLGMLAHPPPPWHPRHRDDHPPPNPTAATSRRRADDVDGADDVGDLGEAAAVQAPVLRLGERTRGGPLPEMLTRTHPVDEPGPYRVPAGLRRLLQARRPWCEWPGCGVRSERCDMDHDLAWPDGPTCGCNLGPKCRRHHRIKQLFWTISRTREATLRWSSPTGRTWTSPVPHDPPAPGVRPLPTLPDVRNWPEEHDAREPVQDDAHSLELRVQDAEPQPDTTDPLRERLLHSDTRWSLDLDNPYRWEGARLSRTDAAGRRRCDG